ncbi:MAG: hypothetical protein HY060_00060 [Proteobacteria bacterium]|nr:hypothetical protein [Pseudomonadota bacterium]
MPRTLVAAPLAPDDLLQAFPLARALVPQLELTTWLDFARRQSGKPTSHGIIAVRDDRGYFHGLFSYEIRHALGDGVTLEVGLAVAMELLDRAGPAAAVLLEEIDALAARLRCAAVQVHLRPDQRRLRRRFEGSGHGVCGVVLGRTIVAAAPLTP